jgi:hypothetical protein
MRAGAGARVGAQNQGHCRRRWDWRLRLAGSPAHSTPVGHSDEAGAEIRERGGRAAGRTAQRQPRQPLRGRPQRRARAHAAARARARNRPALQTCHTAQRARARALDACAPSGARRRRPATAVAAAAAAARAATASAGREPAQASSGALCLRLSTERQCQRGQRRHQAPECVRVSLW